MHRPSSLTRILLVVSLATGLLAQSAPFAAAAESSTRLEAVDLAAGDPNKVYIAGGFAPDEGVVSRSTDGGATWRSEIFGDSGEHWLHAVSTSSDGSSVMASNNQSFNRVEVSTNAGVSWDSAQHPATGDEAAWAGLAHFPGGRRIAVGTRNSFGDIYSSLGGGAWSQLFEGPIYPPNGSTPAPTTHAYLSAVDVAPAGVRAWAVGNDWTSGSNKARIYRSLDGGANWPTTSQYGETASPWVTCVTAADNDFVFIGRRNQYVLRTIDAGVHWTQLNAIVPTIYVNAIDSFGPTNVVVVGDSGRVSYSANANATTPTWTSRNPAGVTTHLRGVKMIDADSWIVVGDNETILRTDDAGLNWVGSKALGKPTVAITSPAAGFNLGSTAINVAGTSADPGNPVPADGSGIGVADVQVAVQRKIDSKYWNGSAWQSTAVWLDASKTTPGNGWDAWNASATIDSIAGVGDGVIVWARSRDGLGQYSTAQQVSSAQPSPNQAPVLDPVGDKTVTEGQTLSFDVTATDGDGSDTLTFSAEDLPSGATLDSDTGAFSFTPTNAQIGIHDVLFRVSDGKSSDTEAVTITVTQKRVATKVALSSSSIVVGYGAKATIKGTLKAGTSPLPAGTAVALKRNGKWVQTAKTGTGGAFSFYFTPSNTATVYTISYGGGAGYVGSWAAAKVIPKAKVERPRAPKTVRRYRYFTSYTYLYPKHATGAGGTTFYFYRYQKKSNGSYGYVLKKKVSAKAKNSSTYPTKSRVAARVKLPKGKWRVSVRHADYGHYSTYSSYKSFRVK